MIAKVAIRQAEHDAIANNVQLRCAAHLWNACSLRFNALRGIPRRDRKNEVGLTIKAKCGVGRVRPVHMKLPDAHGIRAEGGRVHDRIHFGKIIR